MHKHITLSQLSTAIGGAISTRFPAELWVVGEVSECKVNASGHFYLTLVERNEGSSAPTAELKATIWASSYRVIASEFRALSGSDIESGMKLLFRCRVNYHPNYGISVNITEVDSTYTLGEGERMRQLTINRLQKEGVWSMQREQNSMPRVIQRLAVISSATAAGFEDFCKQLDSSPYRFEVELFEAMMQGEKSESTIVDALSRVYNSDCEFDTVIIIRGGGSASDLRWFDSYEICSHIAQFPLPVLTGIGHEKDTSVADMVAFHAFKTPTAVASTLIDRIAVVDNELQSLGAQVVGLAQYILLNENSRVNSAAQNLRARTLQTLQNSTLQLEKLKNESSALSFALLERHRNRISTLATQFSTEVQFTLRSAEVKLRDSAQRLKNQTNRLLQTEALKLQKVQSIIAPSAIKVIEHQRFRISSLRSAVPNYATRIVDSRSAKLEYLSMTFKRLGVAITQKEQSRLDMFAERVNSHNPRRILSLGYSLAIDSQGRVIKSVAHLEKQQQLRVELSDGVVFTTIDDIKTKGKSR